MKSVTGKRLCTILEARGWQLRRISGSHHIYTKTGVRARISVPVHAGEVLKRGLQRHLMKIARIDESEL